MGELDRLLERQAGVLTRRQALAHGWSKKAMAVRLRSGRWQRLHGGVYATFSGRPDRAAQLWAALLWAGPGATLSHETAAEVDGLVDAPGDVVHVTVPSTRRVRRVPGVEIHLSARVEAARRPIRTPPRTSVEETVLDLVARARRLDEAQSWVARACGRRLTTPDRLMRALTQRARMPWRRELAEALADVRTGAHSLLELRYLRDVERAHGLPRGMRQRRTQRRGRTQWDDVRYRAQRTTVELDGRIGHADEGRWRDMRRDNAGVAEGEAVLRYGWADVTERACESAAQVARVLRRRGWKGSPRPCGPSCVITKLLTPYGGYKSSRSPGLC